MHFRPPSVQTISLLCGTNNWLSTTRHHFRHGACNLIDTSSKNVQLLLSILSLLYRGTITITHKYVSLISILIFGSRRVLLGNVLLLMNYPPSLYNANVYRDDKVHLTNKGNDSLAKDIH